MNILLISSRNPYPPHGGHSQRTFNLIKYAAQNHDIFLLTFVEKDENLGNVSAMRKISADVYPFYIPDEQSKWRFALSLIRNLFSPLPYTAQKYDTSEMRCKIRELLEEREFDILQCDAPDLAQYTDEVGDISKVVVNHNVESKLMYRRCVYARNILEKMYLYFQSFKMRKYERRICERFDNCVVVSEIDKEELQRISPEAKISVVPNGVDIEYFRPTYEDFAENTLIFVGGMTWFPNLDGALWFCEEIWPLVKREIPEPKMSFIGRNPPKKVLELAKTDNIEAPGFVDDIRPYVSKAAVYVVPLRVGGGTRLKILDAMAMGKAVVSTSIGCEGLEVTPEENIIVADSAEEFAKRTVELLRNPDLIKRLGIAGRKLTEEKYDWNIIGMKMEEVYQACV